jgi:hypothetical protein
MWSNWWKGNFEDTKLVDTETFDLRVDIRSVCGESRRYAELWYRWVSCSHRTHGEYGERNCLNICNCDLCIEIGKVPEEVNNFHKCMWNLLQSLLLYFVYRVGVVVKALRYKPVGRGFDSRWWHNPSGRTVALGWTQPLTEMSTRCISWG